ncbi:putative S-adenosylmethionine-dependent methyltransferase At5g37990 [Morella rubra]|uniref:Putative S-adenosylmethionine-dependent methyltransferase At5g37990 n=1 Tax=Morella rubra TaxID=262757 RepID=A0A6A1UZQ3_9ROSI|nr:putative S-adenosylmethionine-dependent methyltransferase At5g37990 [Morella rubra]
MLERCEITLVTIVQKLSASVEKEKIDEEIAKKLDVVNFCSASNTIRIADLGCGTGSNTFIAMRNLIEAVVKKYQSLCIKLPLPEFQVFFNDQASNDFNTLFNVLPEGNTLQPVCQVLSIAELCDKNSLACNKGRVHYTSAPNEVFHAYSAQFAKDVDNFLNARAKELVHGGLMIMILSGITEGTPYSQIPTGTVFDMIAAILLDMATEGLIHKDQVDTFNLPFYAASPEMIAGLVEKNGHFNIERLELTNPSELLEGPVDSRAWIMHLRAAMEDIFTKHFGREITNQMFEQLIRKLSSYSAKPESRSNDKVQLFIVLKSK